jgi:hypothetical protein
MNYYHISRLSLVFDHLITDSCKSVDPQLHKQIKQDFNYLQTYQKRPEIMYSDSEAASSKIGHESHKKDIRLRLGKDETSYKQFQALSGYKLSQSLTLMLLPSFAMHNYDTDIMVIPKSSFKAQN